jgi:hypothetical protein
MIKVKSAALKVNEEKNVRRNSIPNFNILKPRGNQRVRIFRIQHFREFYNLYNILTY